jgi:hypothetical protein
MLINHYSNKQMETELGRIAREWKDTADETSCAVLSSDKSQVSV